MHVHLSMVRSRTIYIYVANRRARSLLIPMGSYFCRGTSNTRQPYAVLCTPLLDGLHAYQRWHSGAASPAWHCCNTRRRWGSCVVLGTVTPYVLNSLTSLCSSHSQRVFCVYLKKNMKKINKSKVRRHVGTSHTHTPSRMQTYRGFTRTQAIHVTESHCIV